MTREEHDAILKSKIDKLINMQMVAEKWYPEKVPFKENGEVDFTQFGNLWKQEVEKRNWKYIQNALNGDDYDVYSSDGKTPNIDRLLSEQNQTSNYIDEVPMNHPKR